MAACKDENALYLTLTQLECNKPLRVNSGFWTVVLSGFRCLIGNVKWTGLGLGRISPPWIVFSHKTKHSFGIDLIKLALNADKIVK